MKLGLSMLFRLGEPLKKALGILPKALEAGVEVIELVDEALHSLRGRKLDLVIRAFSGLGLSIAVHAPFVDLNIGSPYEPMRRFSLMRHFMSMEAARRLDAVAWVFHPGLRTGITHHYPGVEWRRTLRSIREIYSKAEELGLRALLENAPEPFPFVLKRVEDFERLFSEIGPDVEVELAFDIGHAHLCGQVEEFVRAFGGRIGYVHAHDNDGTSDIHLGIGHGSVNWPSVLRALREVGYRGPVVVESVEDVWGSLSRLKALLA